MLYFLSPQIIECIITDTNFRLKLALALEIGERPVYNTAKKYKDKPFGNSTFTKMAAVKFFEQEGYSIDDILTTDQPAQ